ncbi:MAG: hypothetical protein Q8O24_02315 [Gallionellaceae bacterium]|nr:hypothetical protein [Gallionellaceae bacterium]
MSLSKRTLLFLSAEHFQACSWESGKLSDAHYFSNDSDGRENFSAYLQQHKEPALLLVDVIEEDFRHESVPHLIGSNKRALIERKFEQYYRNTLFRQAKLLHRQEDGRRDDEMLFSALTNPQRISPWLDTLLINGTPLIGIYSLPNISNPLLKDIESDHVLLLTWENHAGLRQTYFNNKRLHFSRLTPFNSSNVCSDVVVKETPRTQQYLKSLSLPPPGEILDVYIVCHADDKTTLESKLESTSDLHYHFLDIQAISDRFKSKDTYKDSDSTSLFLHLLASKPPVSHYATSEHTRYYILWQLRWILFGLAAVVALVGALWSSISFWQGSDYTTETAPLLSQAAQLNQQTEAIQRQFPITTIPAADMKAAVTSMRKFDSYYPVPEEVLVQITNVLSQYTKISPSKIEWKTSTADAAPSAYPAQIISFDGELLGFGNDYRSSLDYLERFQKALTEKGYVVTTQKPPLDISSQGSINGDFQSAVNKSSAFSLKLIWRHPE